MFTTLSARVAATFSVLLALLETGLRGRHASLRTASAGVRAVTFIEYALLAAIAVVIAAIFRTQLTAIFTDLLGRFRGATATS